MGSHKEKILIAFQFLVVLFIGIAYVNKVRKCNELEDSISMKNILISNEMDNESDVSKEELAIILCERGIQELRDNMDKCKLQQRNLAKQISDNNAEGLQQILRIGQERLDECFEERHVLSSTYMECNPKYSLSREDTSIYRNGSSVNKIKNFIVFLGYPRSGASIVGALLDGHPNVVISNEFNPVIRWIKSQSGKEPKFNRFELFRNIKNAAWAAINTEDGTRSKFRTNKYYSLYVPGLYQGEYKDYIQIIGDKQDNLLVDYDEGDDGSKNFIQMLERFKDFVGYQVKFIHIVRNPFDNIATVLLYNISSRNQMIKFGGIINQPEILLSFVKEQFVMYEKIQRYMKYFGERLLTLNHEDLISEPTLFIKRMCNHMEIYCGKYYLKIASNSVFSDATKSRHSVEWDQHAITMIESAIQNYTFLNRYTFEN
ncbi:hypothetical protein LOD99_9850 [Oopsacas minuta]|uniref:Protein-tyrosine sulfotransferase n=1 Tax=Oopsacas minuta TaxID=111878 RepID=A0AAV7KL50_9METZ|nr:hypothetical protein LOD99_9850 [Oopsacas minuta]